MDTNFYFLAFFVLGVAKSRIRIRAAKDGRNGQKVNN